MKKPRACMVAYTFYDGDNRVRRYAETLIEEGWEVDAVVLTNDGAPKRRMVNGVQVIGIQKRDFKEKGKLSYLSRLLLFLLLSFFFLLKRSFTKHYALVHVHSIPDFEVFAALGPKIFGAKIILDIHDIVPELFVDKFNAAKHGALFKLLLLAERLSCGFADHVIIANEIWRQRLIGRSVHPDKCMTIMNFPDPRIFKPALRERNDDKFLLMYPGTLSKHQGIESAIKAVVEAKKMIPELEFHVYGKGTDEEYFMNVAASLGATEYILFKGPAPLEEVARLMAQVDIGIEPKLNGFFSGEAFSTKILEFMQQGIPVITSDTVVHKYYIPEDTVHFFSAADVNALAQAIIEMHKARDLSELKARMARFINDNNWTARRGMYVDLVNNLCHSLIPVISVSNRIKVE